MKRLNGWQRIGVVLSVIWLVGGGMLTYQIVGTDGPCTIGRTRLSEADQLALKLHDIEKVSDAGLQTLYRACNEEIYFRSLIWTLIPVAAAWLLVYVMVGVVRWVRAGFAA